MHERRIAVMSSVSPTVATVPGVAETPAAPGTTYDDIYTLLTDISARLQRVETFVDEVTAVLNSMPKMPFLPAFKIGGPSNGG